MRQGRKDPNSLSSPRCFYREAKVRGSAWLRASCADILFWLSWCFAQLCTRTDYLQVSGWFMVVSACWRLLRRNVQDVCRFTGASLLSSCGHSRLCFARRTLSGPFVFASGVQDTHAIGSFSSFLCSLFSFSNLAGIGFGSHV